MTRRGDSGAEYMAWRTGPASNRMRAFDARVSDALSDRAVDDVLAGLAPRDDLDDLPFTIRGDDDG